MPYFNFVGNLIELYFGKTILTSCPSFFNSEERAGITSPSPPTFANGSHSDVASYIFICGVDEMVLNN